MTDRAKNHLILLAMLVLLGLTAVVAVVRSPVLGLDLRGGLEVVLKAVPNDPKNPPTQAQINQAISIIRSRVDKLGVSEPEIRKEANNEVSIALAGIKDPKAAASIIGSTGQLYMLDYTGTLEPIVSKSASGTAAYRPSLYALLKAAKNRPNTHPYAGATPEQWYAFNAKTHKRLLNSIGQPWPPGASKKQLLSDLRGQAKGAVLLRAPAGTIWADDPVAASSGTPAQDRFVMFRMPSDKNMVVFGKDVRNAKSDYDPQSGPDVTMGFSGTGTKAFHAITADLASRGRLTQNTEVPFAVILDNKIEATPTISYQRTPGGIDGNAQITGLTSSEANRIALVLQSGSLPVTFNTLSQSQVSATLGKDSLRQALIAGFLGLLVVMIYLLVFYRLLGAVADLALLIYAAFFYGLIVLIPITMTLPGIAGMILTIGVAADANVVIFERIKEEVRLSKTVRAAISSGYTKGFRTIIDANVVTLITAGVLFMAGTGSVKGFAFTLAVGVLVSMFTAVLATRAMLGVLSGFRWFNNAAMMGASGQKVRWRADITGRKYLWFVISGVVVLIAAGSLATRGLNLGIDFKGGTAIETTFEKPATQQQVINVLAGINGNLKKDAVVQGRSNPDAPAQGDKYRRFEIKAPAKALPPTAINKVETQLNQKFGIARDKNDKSPLFDSKSVSASFGRTILIGALYAIIFSMFLIVGYLSFRFEFKYALPTIVALLHDVIITIGVYSLTGRVVTAATVAAVLTVLGYSLYDTIIVFDRVRENTPLLRKNSFAQIVNVSIWETLTRSLNTSLITLFPIATLLVFGGATLKDFAFALLIGIASGAYSSIFIAAPLLSLWKGHEKEFRRRQATSIEKATLGTVLPGLAGGTGGGAATATATVPVRKKADAMPEGVPVPELSDEERAAREAARRRREERRRKQGRGHGRRT
ncbi:MAG: protein translocase subunit SecD [Actinomycetota bacterium]|nr:protein translocase subunit SecD [Actinomycetota bacterium]